MEAKTDGWDLDRFGVHLTHCCQKCGCKYSNDEDCPVFVGAFPAEVECDACGERDEELLDQLEGLKFEDMMRLFGKLNERRAKREVKRG